MAPMVLLLGSPDLGTVKTAVGALGNLAAGKSPEQNALRMASGIAALVELIRRAPGARAAHAAAGTISNLAGDSAVRPQP